MPKATNAVDLIQQQLLAMCAPENSTVGLSAQFVECMTRFDEPMESEMTDMGLFGELKLTRQEGVLYDCPVLTGGTSRESGSQLRSFN